MKSDQDTKQAVLQRRRWRLYIGLTAVVVVVWPAYCGVEYWLSSRATSQLLDMLAAPRPAKQKMGAWQAAEQKNTEVGLEIAAALRAGGITDAEVREAFLQALGRLPGAADAELLTSFATNDPTPEVRQAAWLSLASVFPDSARKLAAHVTTPDEPWDRLGRANALVRAGEMAAVEELLRWARTGDEEQRRVASAGLNNGLVPVLQAIGRWPDDLAPESGTAWAAETLDEVGRIYGEAALQSAADHYQTHRTETAAVVRDVERMTSARAWLARLLFAL